MATSLQAGGRCHRTAVSALHFGKFKYPFLQLGRGLRSGDLNRLSCGRTAHESVLRVCFVADLVTDFPVGRSVGVGRPLFDLDCVSIGVADLHARCLERVVQEPALGIRETTRRERLVDLLDGEETAPDSPGEERFARLVRPPDLQRGHQYPPTPPTPISTPSPR